MNIDDTAGGGEKQIILVVFWAIFLYNPTLMLVIETFVQKNLFRGKESPFGRLRILGLEDLSGKDFNELKSKVEKSSGAVQVLVHPFLDGRDAIFIASPEYEEERDHFVRDALANDIPLIIFEEEGAISDLRRRFNRGTMYVVPTRWRDGSPASIEKDPRWDECMSRATERDVELFAWHRVIATLVRAGVKRANIGGQYMTFIKPKDEEEQRLFDKFRRLAKDKKNASELVNAGIYPNACPGQVSFALLDYDIDVSISTISSPTNKPEPTAMPLKKVKTWGDFFNGDFTGGK